MFDVFLTAGEKFCKVDDINGEIWPKTPDGDTVINRTCPEGRVGYKSRTCKGTTWQPVFSKCIEQELDKVLNAADVSETILCFVILLSFFLFA